MAKDFQLKATVDLGKNNLTVMWSGKPAQEWLRDTKAILRGFNGEAGLCPVISARIHPQTCACCPLQNLLVAVKFNLQETALDFAGYFKVFWRHNP